MLLKVTGNIKDGIIRRLDMQIIGLRPKLKSVKKGSHTYLPQTTHNLLRKEK